MIKNKTFVHLTNIPTPYRINFFNELNKFLKSKNLELFIVYCAKTEPNRNWVFDETKIQYKFKILRGITINIRDFYIHINPLILISLINLKPDLLLIAGSWNMPSAIISLIPFCKKNCPKIFWSEGHKKSVRNPKGFIAFLRRKILKLYDFYAVPNKTSMDFLIDDCNIKRNKIITLPNTIEENLFFRKKTNFQYNKIRKLTIVAALEKRKGFLNLIDALEVLPESIKNKIHLEIIGDGPLYKYLRKKLYELNIYHNMQGNLTPEKVAICLKKSNGFLLPSLIDPNPLSVIEALASGLPLLISKNCGNINECINVNKNGWIFNPENKFELSNILIKWSETSFKDLEEMGKFSKSKYQENFSIKEICREFSKSLLLINEL